MAESNQYTVAVVGNPNCGKTTLFNALTGSKQQVGNWPGVTVEQKVGYFSHKDVRFRLVDLPGTYSLDVAEEEVSIDEKIARDYVAARQADVILNIVDGANLERNLYLTSQLLEMHVPLIVVVNMIDVAKQNGVAIDLAQLSEQLNCPVVAISASNRVGIDGLLAEVRQVAQSPRAPEVQLRYDSEIESAIAQLVQPLA